MGTGMRTRTGRCAKSSPDDHDRYNWAPIIGRVVRRGYGFALARAGGTVAFFAVGPDGRALHVARVADGDGPAETYRCARLLAEMTCGERSTRQEAE